MDEKNLFPHGATNARRNLKCYMSEHLYEGKVLKFRGRTKKNKNCELKRLNNCRRKTQDVIWRWNTQASSPERESNLQNNEEKDNETSASPVEKHEEGCPRHLWFFHLLWLTWVFNVRSSSHKLTAQTNKQTKLGPTPFKYIYKYSTNMKLNGTEIEVEFPKNIYLLAKTKQRQSKNKVKKNTTLSICIQ